MKLKKPFLAFLGALGLILSAFWIAGCGDTDRVISDARETAHQEFDPSVLLQKYSWFKATASQLDAKKANILTQQANVDDIVSQYKGIPRSQWQRADVYQYNQSHEELLDTKLSYNNLAADYNAAMSKFNYAFCNAGAMPQGMPATDSQGNPITPLPRNYAPYSVN